MANPIQQGLKRGIFATGEAILTMPQWLIQYNKDWNERATKQQTAHAPRRNG